MTHLITVSPKTECRKTEVAQPSVTPSPLEWRLSYLNRDLPCLL